MNPLPAPNKPASMIFEVSSFKKRWAELASIHAHVITKAIESIGATLTINPDDHFRYFVVKVGKRTFALDDSWLPRFSSVAKLAQKDRMKIIESITDAITRGFAGGNRDLFYSDIQRIIKNQRNFSSVSDQGVNKLIFHIITDFLRDAGFRFHMD